MVSYNFLYSYFYPEIISYMIISLIGKWWLHFMLIAMSSLLGLSVDSKKSHLNIEG